MIRRLVIPAVLLLVHGALVSQNAVAHWSDSTLVASQVHRNTYNEVWGFVQDDREYAIIGSTAGTHIFDLTDPSNMELLHTIPGGTQGRAIIHRDYHTYGSYLYAVADEGSRSTLQVMDLSYLPDSVAVGYDSSDLIRRSHNIYIDTSHARMYSMLSGRAGQSGFDALAVFDISEPYEPVEIARVNDFEGFSIGHVHDGYIEDNLAFFNCGYDGFAIVDVSDPSDFDLLAAWTPADYPQSGYNHSGWLDQSGDYYYMSDENHGADMKVVNVSTKNEPRLVTTFDAGSSELFDIPHNQIVVGDQLYVSYYFDGLQVFDISDPREPSVAWSYDTSSEPHTNGVYRGAWGVYPFLPSGLILVSDMQEGLFVIEPPTTTTTIDEVPVSTLALYPNPAVDQVSWAYDTEAGAAFEVVDAAGRIVQQVNVPAGHQSVRLDDRLTSGTYMARLTLRGSAPIVSTLQIRR